MDRKCAQNFKYTVKFVKQKNPQLSTLHPIFSFPQSSPHQKGPKTFNYKFKII